jgi:hypothetical protein
MATLREPNRGEKSELVRQLLAENPEGKNTELAAMFKDRMREKGIKEDRDMQQIAQAFANEKAAAKRKAAEAAEGGGGGGKPAGGAKPPRTAVAAKRPAAVPAASAGTFTLDELLAIEALARRVGGYDQLLNLVRWMAERGK